MAKLGRPFVKLSGRQSITYRTADHQTHKFYHTHSVNTLTNLAQDHVIIENQLLFVAPDCECGSGVTLEAVLNQLGFSSLRVEHTDGQYVWL